MGEETDFGKKRPRHVVSIGNTSQEKPGEKGEKRGFTHCCGEPGDGCCCGEV